MLYKEYVKTMHLADILHQLELICHIGKVKMERYRQPLCEMLLAVDPEGKQNVLFAPLPFCGFISDVRISDKALSAEEIEEIWKQ